MSNQFATLLEDESRPMDTRLEMATELVAVTLPKPQERTAEQRSAYEKPKLFDIPPSGEPTLSGADDIALAAEGESREEYTEPKAWTSGDSYRFQPALDAPEGEPWEIIKGGMAKYDKEMCDAWNGELDTMLTFTGLFSAAATSFCVDAFGNLSRDTGDTTNALLFAISVQLANSSSSIASESLVANFTPAKHDVHINVLYFISLILALSVSAVCILAKQWIREYQKDIVGSACDAARVRQIRFDSLEKWKVPELIAALPVVLLAALLLFFAGILIQLWHVSEHTTAAAVTAVVAFTALLVLFTTVAPACYGMRSSRAAFLPFRSPQAWMCLRFLDKLRTSIYWAFYHSFHREPFSFRLGVNNWTNFDLDFLKWDDRYSEITSIHRVFQWVFGIMGGSAMVERAAFWSLQKPELHPPDLIGSQEELMAYALGGFEENVDTSFYHHSTRQYGWEPVDTSLGQYQAELLVRSLNQDLTRREPSEHVSLLWVFTHNIQHMHGCQDHSGTKLIQTELMGQLALALRKLMDAIDENGCPETPEWYTFIKYIAFMHRKDVSPYVSWVNHDTVTRRIPDILRKSKSVALICEVGSHVVSSDWHSSKHFPKLRLFTIIDKVMVELCNSSDGVEELKRENAEKWHELRMEIINDLAQESKEDHSVLPQDYFDAHNGPLLFLGAH